LLTDAETDGWGSEDVTKDAVIELLPVLVDLTEQRYKCHHRLLRLGQQPLGPNPGPLGLLNIDNVGDLLPLLEPFNPLPPVLSCEAVSSDPEFDRIDELGESSLAEQEDVFTRATGVVNVVNVGFLGSDEDVTARKAQEVCRCRHPRRGRGPSFPERQAWPLVEMRRPRAGVRGLTTSASGLISLTGLRS
jgi:hypothetical protein